MVKCEMKKNAEGCRTLEMQFATREALAEWAACTESHLRVLRWTSRARVQ